MHPQTDMQVYSYIPWPPACSVRERTLALHMEHFVCGAVKDKSLQEMRAKTYQVRWAERKKDLEKPEW